MFTRVLIAALLTVAAGCGEKLIGDASEEAGRQPDAGAAEGGVSEEEIEFSRLVEASEALDGDWLSPSNPFRLLFGIGPANVTMTLTHADGSKRGTFRAKCPERCLFSDAGDAPSFELRSGEYELLGFTKQGWVRGTLYSDEYAIGLTFNMGAPTTPRDPGEIFVDVLGLPIQLTRVDDGPGPGP